MQIAEESRTWGSFSLVLLQLAHVSAVKESIPIRKEFICTRYWIIYEIILGVKLARLCTDA